nr:hypothetical protein [uncultured Albidiferax sp.]
MATQPPADDPDLKAAQIEKLRAETAKLSAEKKKIEEEAAVVPRIATGSHWSEVIKVVGAIVLGIGGFVTAAGSYFVARNQVELAELKSTNAAERAKAAEAAASAASASVAAAVKLRDEARKDEAEAIKNTAELRKSLAEVTATVQTAKPDLLKRRLVYIQFQGSLQRPVVDELRKALESQSFSAPGAERLGGDYQSLVKFFRTEDEAAAASLMKSTQDFFASKGCPVQLRIVQAKAAATAPPLELWLAHSCKQ